MKLNITGWRYEPKLDMWLEITVSEIGVRSLNFTAAPASLCHDSQNRIMRDVIRQLDQYFIGTLKRFDVPLDLEEKSLFRIKVWNALLVIPYGETRSYGEVALGIGHARAARAVGTANSRNPVPIIIPCHRVIRNDGSIGQYSSGAGIKRILLEHEGAGFRTE